jgi:hypothetical protein
MFTFTVDSRPLLVPACVRKKGYHRDTSDIMGSRIGSLQWQSLIVESYHIIGG